MNNPNPIDDVIDLALSMGDFEWVKELSEVKYGQTNKATVAEKITIGYGVLENGRILAIHSLTEKEFILNTLVKLSKSEVYIGEVVEYVMMNTYDKYFLYGYFTGKSSMSMFGFKG